MAIKANFSPTPGLLSVFDDNADDTSRSAATRLGKFSLMAVPSPSTAANRRSPTPP